MPGPAMTRADPVPADAGALAEVRDYLRIDATTEDPLTARLIAMAVAHGEAFTSQMFVARGVVETLPLDGMWRRLARTPVEAITQVAVGGTALPVEAYAIDIDANGDGWVRSTAPGTALASVSYVAGIATGWAGLPEPLRQGAVRLAAHLFTHRDAADESAPPAAVAALWRPWRRMRLT